MSTKARWERLGKNMLLAALAAGLGAMAVMPPTDKDALKALVIGCGYAAVRGAVGAIIVFIEKGE